MGSRSSVPTDFVSSRRRTRCRSVLAGRPPRACSSSPRGTPSTAAAATSASGLPTRRASARRCDTVSSDPRARGSGAMARARRSGAYWPVLVVVLLSGGAAANIGMMLLATRDTSFAVEPDYYRKALEWNETMAQAAKNAALGWSVAVQLERTPESGAVKLIARVRDRAGQDVAGARVGIER